MKKKNDITSWRNDKKDIFAIFGDNKKILMPIILVVAVVLTVSIALIANRRTTKLAQTPSDANAAATYEIPDVEMEENAYSDVNALVETYFNAIASGDSQTLSSIYVGLDDTELLKAVVTADYIEGYENVTVYTKPGPVSGSYIVYAYNEVKLYDYEKAIPGLESLYICTADDGTLYINGDVADENVLNYIKNISLQGDVIDLNNKVASNYNEMVNSDEKLAELLTTMRSGIQVSVGEALASAEASTATSEDGAAESSTDEETVEDTNTVTVQTIRATDVINIRSSDSETADVLAKTEKGEEFTQLESLANGWSKIEYNGGEAYVKTEFFEVVGEETIEATEASESDDTGETETETSSETETETTSNSNTSYKTGKMTVNDTVRLRKSESTDSEILDMIYSGSTVNVIEQYANGWAKVEYNGSTGYIKTEYLE